MKIALFYPRNTMSSYYTLGGYRLALERMGHEVLDVWLPPEHRVRRAVVDEVKARLPRIEELNQCDCILVTFLEHICGWLEVVYGREAWQKIKTPKIGRFDESFDRADYQLSAMWPQLERWADYFSFPAAQDAERYGWPWIPYGVDTSVFNSNGGQDAKLYPVGFIGSLYEKRQEYARQLVPRLNGIRIHHTPVLVQDLSGPLGREQTDLLAKNYRQIKIFFCFPPMSQLLVCKAFEVMGSGTFLMYPRLEGEAAKNLAAFNHNQHLIYYQEDAYEENAAQICYYLEHEEERERIAAAGCAEVHKNHTIEGMFERMLAPLSVNCSRQQVLGSDQRSVYSTPTFCPRGQPKWSILILTQPSRDTLLRRLLTVLIPQTVNQDEVQVMTQMFDPGLSLGENRQQMIEAAAGEYVSFIDDDDMVPPYFVRKIVPRLDGVDYIGFQVQCLVDGRKLAPTYHSLKYGGWSEDKNGYYRDLSHLNPIRRDLALKVPFEGGFAEDHRWADRLRALNVVKTEHYIPEIMYWYYFRSKKADVDQSVEAVDARA